MTDIEAGAPWSDRLDAATLRDDNGDPIGTREFIVAEGLPFVPGDAVSNALDLLTAAELLQLMANRAHIEQATGILMALYGIDAEDAMELLQWRSQETDANTLAIATQLVAEFPALTVGQRLPTPTGYDQVLLTVHQRIPK